MKTTSVEFIGELQAHPSYLAQILRIQRPDGVIHRMTTATKDLIVDGELYKATNGFSPTNIVGSSDGGIGQVTILLYFIDNLNEPDARSGKLDRSVVRYEWVSWRAPEFGSMLLMHGVVNDSSITNERACQIVVNGQLALGTRPLGEVRTPDCRAVFGDHRCKWPADMDLTFTANAGTNVLTAAAAHGWELDGSGPFFIWNATPGDQPGGLTQVQNYFVGAIDGLTFKLFETQANAISGTSPVDITDAGTGTHKIRAKLPVEIDAINGLTITVLGADFALPTLFNQGFIEFTSGEMDGEGVDLGSHIRNFNEDEELVNVQVKLYMPTQRAIVVGDTAFLYPGCSKTILRCKFFNNIINMRAEPYVPSPSYQGQNRLPGL